MQKKGWFYFRLTLLLLGIIALIWQFTINPETYHYFTIQSNFFILIWLILAVIYDIKEIPLVKLNGMIRGAILLYLTITFLVNLLLLGGGYPNFTNYVHHYIIPIGTLMDWYFTEKEVHYEWRYLGFWLIYPILYMIISLIVGNFTGFYPYFFLNINQIGISMVIVWIAILVVVFVVIGSLLIKINQILHNKRKSNPKMNK